MRQSARSLGIEVGLSARETNELLQATGFLSGIPGAYEVTEKGRPYADEHHHTRGTGGYSHYNRDWITRDWDTTVLDELRKPGAARVRRESSPSRGLEVNGADPEGVEDEARPGSNHDPLKVVVLLVSVAAATGAFVLVTRHLKKRRKGDSTSRAARLQPQQDRT